MNRIKVLIRTIMTIVGVGVGLGIYFLADTIVKEIGFESFSQVLMTWAVLAIMIALAVIFGLIFYFLSPALADWFLAKEKELKNVPTIDMISAVAGLIVGLFIAYLLTRLLQILPPKTQWFIMPVSIGLYIVLSYLGISIGLNKRDEIKGFFSLRRKKEGISFADDTKIKLLDTSAIIDGRVYDVALTGFLEGKICVPDFVLTELRHIADSEDDLKRGRGRRGLDILMKMQALTQIDVEVLHKDIPEIPEVDAKLIKMAQMMNGAVVTNDYNLNKVAEVQGVSVLNVNDLANAVKPVALPGEKLYVRIVKEGKEQMQGVAFLPDGTMIVVSDAKNKIGEDLQVEVTSALQTSAGRMIFARIVG